MTWLLCVVVAQAIVILALTWQIAGLSAQLDSERQRIALLRRLR